VRGFGDADALELVLNIPAQLNDGVFADPLFDQVAMRVVAMPLIFKHLQPVVLDEPLRRFFGCAVDGQHVVRRIEPKPSLQTRLCSTAIDSTEESIHPDPENYSKSVIAIQF